MHKSLTPDSPQVMRLFHKAVFLYKLEPDHVRHPELSSNAIWLNDRMLFS